MKGLLIFVGIVLFIAVLGGFFDGRPAQPPRAMTYAEREADRVRSARSGCRHFIRTQLHDPRSAEFEPMAGYPTTKLPNDRYRVMVTLRAKNAFGALVLGQYLCEIRLEDSNLRLMKLEQL